MCIENTLYACVVYSIDKKYIYIPPHSASSSSASTVSAPVGGIYIKLHMHMGTVV